MFSYFFRRCVDCRNEIKKWKNKVQRVLYSNYGPRGKSPEERWNEVRLFWKNNITSDRYSNGQLKDEGNLATEYCWHEAELRERDNLEYFDVSKSSLQDVWTESDVSSIFHEE